jgi:hypothetical protein
MEMLLKKILGLFLRARGEYGKRNSSQGGQGKMPKKLSSRIMLILFILHRDFLPDGKGLIRVSKI